MGRGRERGVADENLAGFALSNQQYHNCIFLNFILASGASARIHTGSGKRSDC